MANSSVSNQALLTTVTQTQHPESLQKLDLLPNMDRRSSSICASNQSSALQSHEDKTADEQVSAHTSMLTGRSGSSAQQLASPHAPPVVLCSREI